MQSSFYVLPCSPSVLCEDRFSILDLDELQVPFWPLFETLLKRHIGVESSIGSLIDTLETLAISLRGKNDTDFEFLKDFLREQHEFCSTTLPLLAQLALEMPILFPEHSLPILCVQTPELKLSRRQTACLVAHQFFCTLSAPEWQDGFQDFHIWYSSEQPHSAAVRAYLKALFTYFSRVFDRSASSPLAYSSDEWSVTYTLRSGVSQLETSDWPLGPFSVVRIPLASTAPSLLGLPTGAAVISANKFIGFGKTATQEETHVGGSPEACPAVLVTPPLSDSEVLVVTGVEAIVAISGYGREAVCDEVLRPASDGKAHAEVWRGRKMLFMDALELDVVECAEGLPDLQPGNVEREMKKAYTAFASVSPGAEITTGFWGCRTFGGNPYVKALIQWSAASQAGQGLKFVCSGEEEATFGEELERFVSDMRNGANIIKARSKAVLDALLEMEADTKQGSRAFELVKARIETSAAVESH